ncbi:MAG TPA: hypothetical protein VHA12_03225, partial [Candidatus Nanoarchaeia archaeon]|nr:hypothetical protein [Candidatus Nanoarchaeia archaeon]
LTMAKEKSKSKGKNDQRGIKIASFILVAVVLLVFALGYISPGKEKVSENSSENHYPDKDGFNRKVLEGDKFTKFFPEQYKEGFFFVSPNESGIINTQSPLVDGKRYIEYRENVSINMSEAGVLRLSENRRTFYARNDSFSPLVFKLWVEKLENTENYTQYSEYLVKDAKRQDTPKLSYKNHDYYVSIRNNMTYDYLKNKKVVGVAYVLFPEDNLVVSINFFNTKYAPNAYIISEDEIKSVCKQLIDSTLN